MSLREPSGAGLGFRRELLPAMEAGVPDSVAFFELAPENWAGTGGRQARQLRGLNHRVRAPDFRARLSRLDGQSSTCVILVAVTEHHGINLHAIRGHQRQEHTLAGIALAAVLRPCVIEQTMAGCADDDGIALADIRRQQFKLARTRP